MCVLGGQVFLVFGRYCYIAGNIIISLKQWCAFDLRCLLVQGLVIKLCFSINKLFLQYFLAQIPFFLLIVSCVYLLLLRLFIFFCGCVVNVL